MKYGSNQRKVSFKNSTDNQIIAQSNNCEITLIRHGKDYKLSWQYYEDRETNIYKTLNEINISALADLVFFEDKLTPEEIDTLKSAVFYECNVCHSINASPIKSALDCRWCNAGPMFSIDASMVSGMGRKDD